MDRDTDTYRKWSYKNTIADQAHDLGPVVGTPVGYQTGDVVRPIFSHLRRSLESDTTRSVAETVNAGAVLIAHSFNHDLFKDLPRTTMIKVTVLWLVLRCDLTDARVLELLSQLAVSGLEGKVSPRKLQEMEHKPVGLGLLGVIAGLQGKPRVAQPSSELGRVLSTCILSPDASCLYIPNDASLSTTDNGSSTTQFIDKLPDNNNKSPLDVFVDRPHLRYDAFTDRSFDASGSGASSSSSTGVVVPVPSLIWTALLRFSGGDTKVLSPQTQRDMFAALTDKRRNDQWEFHEGAGLARMLARAWPESVKPTELAQNVWPHLKRGISGAWSLLMHILPPPVQPAAAVLFLLCPNLPEIEGLVLQALFAYVTPPVPNDGDASPQVPAHFAAGKDVDPEDGSLSDVVVPTDEHGWVYGVPPIREVSDFVQAQEVILGLTLKVRDGEVERTIRNLRRLVQFCNSRSECSVSNISTFYAQCAYAAFE